MFDKDRAKSLIDKVNIVSFDVFDTLLDRIVTKPEDIFDIMEQYLQIPHFSEIRQEEQTKASMAVMREKSHPHANFDEIYQYLEKHHPEISDWDAIKSLELQMEGDGLVANREMKEIFDYAKQEGKRVIITSDMYFQEKEVAGFLKKNGFDGYQKLYVSSDVWKTKYEGDIYPWIAAQEQTDPHDILHIGDNSQSDRINAEKHGWQTFLYERAAYQSDLKQISASKCLGVENQEFWHRLGCQVGGSLYLGILLWLRTLTQEKHFQKVFFMARDGYILQQLCKNAGIPDTEYLYTSRRAMLMAGITTMDEEALSVLPPYTFGQTIREILEYLQIDDTRIESLEECGFVSLDDKILSLDAQKRVKQLFRKNENLFLERCENERVCAREYLENIGALEEDVLFFDSGWNGSSQYFFNRLLKAIGCKNETSFAYIGIKKSAKSEYQLKNQTYVTYLFDINKNTEIQKEIMSSVVIFELFFGAPHASVWYYDEQGPVLESTEETGEIKANISQGVLDFVGLTGEFCYQYGLVPTLDEVLNPLKRLINDPTEEEARMIGNLENADGFTNLKEKKKYVAYLSLRDYLKNPKTEIYWLPGFFKRSDVSKIVKHLVAKVYGIDYHIFRKKSRVHITEANVETGIRNQLLQDIRQEHGEAVAECIRNQIKAQEELPDRLYQEWIRQNEWDAANSRQLAYEPLISVVIPVYNVLEEQLTACIESIRRQTYTNWEMILVDDHSTWECVGKTLHRYENDDKITIIYRETNGNISEATNTGLEAVRGEFVAFADCDDVVAKNAFYEFARVLNKRPELDFLYSDEDKLSEDGKHRHSPFFKPDWSPDTFMSIMYTNHLALYRTELVKKTGKLRTAFNGAQDYDFTLRFMELTDDNHVGHIPKVLYYWRERAESLAAGAEAKPYALEAVKKAKEEALERRGLKGEVEYVEGMSQYRIVYRNESCPLVSIIIPSKDHFDLLKVCIDSILAVTEYPNYEFIVIDNGSGEAARKEIESYLVDKRATYYYEKMEFNFSRMCNIGASLAHGEFLLFLNDDIENFQTDWLGRLVGHASLKHVGAVGAKLYYPESDIIQHAGVLNLKIGPAHAFLGKSDSIPYYFGRNRVDYNMLILTGACMMVEKCKFEKIEGFNENLKVAYNDVDLCMKLYESGYYNVLRNDVILYHHESASRGDDSLSEEKKFRLAREKELLYSGHRGLINKDPFYNKNLEWDDCQLHVIEDTSFKEMEESKMKLETMSGDIEWNIDDIKYYANILSIQGWGFDKNLPDNNDAKKYIMIEGRENERYFFECEATYRPDVVSAFADIAKNIEICGYKVRIPSEILNPVRRDYRLSLVIKTKQSTVWSSYQLSLNQLVKPENYLDESTEHIDIKNVIGMNEDIEYDLQMEENADGCYLHGWAFCKENNSQYYMRVAFVSPSGYVISKVLRPEKRLDIAQRYIQIPHIAYCGFCCKFTNELLERLEDGTEGGLLFIDKQCSERKFFEKIPKLTKILQ